MVSRIGSRIGGQAVQVFVSLVIGEPAALAASDHQIDPVIVMGTEIVFQVED
jgi:xanthosine utilization system XapX-like protein